MMKALSLEEKSGIFLLLTGVYSIGTLYFIWKHDIENIIMSIGLIGLALFGILHTQSSIFGYIFTKNDRQYLCKLFISIMSCLASISAVLMVYAAWHHDIDVMGDSIVLFVMGTIFAVDGLKSTYEN